jgi:hypothetical protein
MQNLVNMPTTPATPGTQASTGGDKVGIFITKESLVTFPVASTLVTFIWKVLSQVFSDWSNNKLVPLAVALLIGFLIYWNSTTRGMTRKEKILEASIALLNSFMLAAAALGISGTVTPS